MVTVVKLEAMDLDKINFKYKFSDAYNPVYVNGAYGGVNPRGEIVINFYFERPTAKR